MTIDVVLFHIGVVVFSITGVLAAARQDMDVMSFVIIGVVTAVGGGTLRDLMLDQPLFWLEESSYLYTAALAAVATFFFEQRFRATLRAFLYLDAIATALFTVLAIEKTLKLGFEPAPMLMGLILGPMMEENMRRAMTVSRGDPTVFIQRPLSAALLAIAAALLLVVVLPTVRRGREKAFQD